jgi:tRNA A64-2'-O-ribosylphosphate transferase
MQANAAAADDDDDLEAIPPPGGLRVGSVCRLVKKTTSKAFNRAASAAADAVAVAGFLDYPGEGGLCLSSLPVFANARAGLWHVDLNGGPRGAVRLCRFKSTDGHAAAAGGAGGSFPLSRLNLGVAAAAAAAARGGGGGAVVVDATRKGKRFPDALSRTIPIWAAVVNRACRIWTEEGEAGEEKEREKGGGGILLMPPWVPASERSKVGERIEGWARLLLSTGVDLSAFARDLSERPLLPVWIARRGGGGEKRGGGGGGGGEEATGGRMDFEVIHARGGEGEEARAVATATTALYLFSASNPSARRATVSCGCGTGVPPKGEQGAAGAPPHPAHGCFDVSFDYEPGGGDDEEGWSRGLSARLFWSHRGELLSRGPWGFEKAAEELLLARGRREGEEWQGGGAASAAPGASPASWTFVCGTRLAVGNAAAAAAALCRSPSALPLFESEDGVAPAVVVLGSGSGGDRDCDGDSDGAPPPPSPASSLVCFFRAPVPARRKLGLLEALPSVVAFASAHLLRGGTVLLTGGDDGESGNENAATAAAAVLLACFSAPLPRAELVRAFGGGGGGSCPALVSRRPCGCPAPPRASRDEVRARVAAVCGSGSAAAAAAGGGEEETSPPLPPSSPLAPLLSVGKEAAKQLLMFVSPPERPGGFPCPACRAGRPARLGAERAAAAAAAALGKKGEGGDGGLMRASGVEA